MSRNKYPEETVNKILDTAQRLFEEKGYEKTTIQDIIDGLGGLSKGAIYHHFKSKEDIMVAVNVRATNARCERLDDVKKDSAMNGAQKLMYVMSSTEKYKEGMGLVATRPNLLENPVLLARHLSYSINSEVPKYIEPFIKEGVADGSISCEYPQELAEVLSLLMNVWLNPFINHIDSDNIDSHIAFFNDLLDKMGLPPLTEGLKEYIKALDEKKELLGVGK